VIQILITILSSSVKFALTFPLAILQFRFNFLETLLWTNVGGIIGIYFFAFLSEKIIAWWNRTFRRSTRKISVARQGEKKIFTKKNRRIVRIKQQYGMIGIAATTPFLLSIPVGTFLMVRYYHARKTRFLYLIISNIVWSVIYTCFYLFWDILLLRRA